MLTKFQEEALRQIARFGGSIYYHKEGDGFNGPRGSWKTAKGYHLTVSSTDRRTEGLIGWPTINALIQQDKLRHVEGAKYQVTGD